MAKSILLQGSKKNHLFNIGRVAEPPGFHNGLKNGHPLLEPQNPRPPHLPPDVDLAVRKSLVGKLLNVDTHSGITKVVIPACNDLTELLGGRPGRRYLPDGSEKHSSIGTDGHSLVLFRMVVEFHLEHVSRSQNVLAPGDTGRGLGRNYDWLDRRRLR